MTFLKKCGEGKEDGGAATATGEERDVPVRERLDVQQREWNQEEDEALCYWLEATSQRLNVHTLNLRACTGIKDVSALVNMPKLTLP